MLRKIKILIMFFLNYLDYIIRIPFFYYNLYFNKSVVKQLKNPAEIPVIVVNYNQLFYFKKNIENLLLNGFKKIIILDNASTYPALLEYYKKLMLIEEVEVVLLNENLGHRVLYKNKKAYDTYCKGFYFLTDADVILNKVMPEKFIEKMITILKKKHFFITKVGSALDISDIPDEYPLKKNVLKWEDKFWQNKISEDSCYLAEIDTTFALYKPCYYPYFFSNFSKAIRIAGNYIAKHGGWYVLPGDLEEERKYYLGNNISTSWVFDNNGKLLENNVNKTY
ncbi:hypothetical protein ABEG63_16705 [Chryseobacterium sp. C39-AII1]|uniref:hypothetical protein n=1 Tax=Chryseobacterium sp. C39-AII1 TaxID=3080332 RepID=UPI0032086941